MKRTILLGLLALLPILITTSASAQCNGVFPNNTVCGNVTGAANLPRATNPAAFQGSAGGLNGQIQYNNAGTLAGFGPITGDVLLTVPGGVTTIVPGSANTVKGSLNGTTVTNLAVPSCVGNNALQYTSGVGFSCAATATANPVIESRAAAILLDLSAFTTVRTLGYSTGGDGGGAVFRKVGAAIPFTDQYIGTFTIQGSSGCAANGSYYAIIWSAPGRPNWAIGVLDIVGGTVTAVTISGTPGQGFAVGDVLSTPSSGGNNILGASTPIGCTPTITVTSLAPVLGSFVDAAGNRWQYTPDIGTYPNVLQFGAKGDFEGTDLTATNNFNAFTAAVNYAAVKSVTHPGAGGYWGGKVLVPSGAFMMCGPRTFVLPESVVLEGTSAGGGSSLSLCDSFGAATNAFAICDPLWTFACIGSQYRHLQFWANRNIDVATGVYMIYSNNLQDFGGVYDVYVYSGQRGCIHYEKGYGGSSWIGMEKISCNQASPDNVVIRIGNTPASGLNLGSTIVTLKDIVISGPTSGAGQLQRGLQILGGFTKVENVHCEGINETCVSVNLQTALGGEMVYLHNINNQGVASGGSCTGTILLESTNLPGHTIIGMVPVSASCPNVVTNNQPGGSNEVNPIALNVIFNP